MMGFNRYGSYGWALGENLKGLAEAHQSNNLEMRGYYKGCIAILAGEMAAWSMRKDNVEFSTDIFLADILSSLSG